VTVVVGRAAAARVRAAAAKEEAVVEAEGAVESPVSQGVPQEERMVTVGGVEMEAAATVVAAAATVVARALAAMWVAAVATAPRPWG
jgi:hypothetical protein